MDTQTTLWILFLQLCTVSDHFTHCWDKVSEKKNLGNDTAHQDREGMSAKTSNAHPQSGIREPIGSEARLQWRGHAHRGPLPPARPYPPEGLNLPEQGYQPGRNKVFQHSSQWRLFHNQSTTDMAREQTWNMVCTWRNNV